MEIKHAVWEQRNMGIDCWEVRIERGDTEEEFVNCQKEFECEYVVVKVPTDMVQYGFFLQEQGYQYVETMISLYRNSSIPELNRIQQRFLTKMEYSEMSDKDRDFLFTEIRKGLFTTDRVYIDPYFSIEQAHERYVGWINDEIRAGAKLYNVCHNGQKIGFFILRELENKVYYPALSGIYQGISAIGMGFYVNYFLIVEANQQDGKKILTSVSTNNKGALSLLMQLGYLPNKIETVYIKHCIGRLKIDYRR